MRIAKTIGPVSSDTFDYGVQVLETHMNNIIAMD